MQQFRPMYLSTALKPALNLDDVSLGCFVAQNLALPREFTSLMTQGLSKHTKLMVMKFDFIQLEFGISLEFKVHYQRFGVFGQCKRRLKVENVMKDENVTEILSKRKTCICYPYFPAWVFHICSQVYFVFSHPNFFNSIPTNFPQLHHILGFRRPLSVIFYFVPRWISQNS